MFLEFLCDTSEKPPADSKCRRCNLMEPLTPAGEGAKIAKVVELTSLRGAEGSFLRACCLKFYSITCSGKCSVMPRENIERVGGCFSRAGEMDSLWQSPVRYLGDDNSHNRPPTPHPSGAFNLSRFNRVSPWKLNPPGRSRRSLYTVTP